MTFFCDRSLGSGVSAALQADGKDVVDHHQHFAQDAQDDEWLTAVGTWGWYVLTKDDRIRYRTLEIAAIQNNNVGCFVVMNRNATRAWLIATIRAAWPAIEAVCATEQRPFVYGIYAGGAVRKKTLPQTPRLSDEPHSTQG